MSGFGFGFPALNSRPVRDALAPESSVRAALAPPSVTMGIVKQSVRLGAVEETLLVPLYARAVESRRKHPILVDPLAIEMVQAIDWDYERIAQRRRMLACVLRTAMFDEFVVEFLRGHPEGTVVEIGAGLNTRFERLDNGMLHWFDLDLPDVVELRRKFFTDSARRTTLSGSIVDSNWIAAVRQSPGPYFFVAETVFVYLQAPEVKAALAQMARNFLGVRVALDTASLRAITRGNKDFARRKMAARFAWACEDPHEVEAWNIGLRLVESRTPFDVAGPLRARLSWPVRTTCRVILALVPNVAKVYRLNLFEGT
jgi:O-methyltransferase involved in polyketide biosynthesis